ncbi:hypothetical protein ACS15_0578 [Ralstonia insidiosa]|uniref:Uncharacterized protein n=1 Tax=Ralstonia insidiosa TaxID=190721 RepID=A0AAC9BFN3_9RALS|nr:hypothetical protein ACS15_0578 [Ralstonia insidiosa]
MRGGCPFDRRLHVPSLFLVVRRLRDGLGKPALNLVYVVTTLILTRPDVK